MEPRLQADHNLYYNPLSASSPAVDTGTTAWSPPDDLVGHSRPVGGAPDLGPYEY